jgi:hypothetical protein
MDNEPTLEIDNVGTKRWRLNTHLHREDGPAIEYVNGTNQWWLYGNLHRVDGPAIEAVDGYKIWCLNGKYYTFDDWVEANNFISEEEKVMLKLIYG